MADTPIYFRFFIDDYLRDAEELSLTRHGVYLRLMLWYYARAKPIPNDLVRIYQRVNARNGEEEGAVKFVLGEFFQLRDGFWFHKRIDAELADWKTRSQAAKASVQLRWEKINENNATTNTNVIRPKYERNTNQNQNQNHKELKAVQDRLVVAIDEKQPQPTRRRATNAATRLQNGWELPDEWLAWAVALRTDWNEERALRESLVFRDHWLSAPGQKGTKADWEATWRNWVRRAT